MISFVGAKYFFLFSSRSCASCLRSRAVQMSFCLSCEMSCFFRKKAGILSSSGLMGLLLI